MNCESAQRDILLSHSGELPAGREIELQRHLAGCRDCREYMVDADRISKHVREFLPSSGPSRETMERIMAAGREKVARKAPFRILSFPATKWLAAAAGFAVLAAGTCLLIVAHSRSDAAAHGLRVSQLSTIVAMVTEDESLAAEAAAHGETRSDVRALANQILRAEGLTAEELQEDEVIIPEDDAQPRDLQSHSTCGSQPEGCV